MLWKRLTAPQAPFTIQSKDRKECGGVRAVFDKEELLVLLRDFYELTGLRTVVFDEWGMDILSYPQELPTYCRLIRDTPRADGLPPV